jgi:hypothetical protein
MHLKHRTMKNKTLAQMNAERAGRRAGHNLKLKNRSRSASASCKPQAASALNQTHSNDKVKK